MPVRYDEAWKRLIMDFIFETVDYALPELAKDLDRSIAPIFLDKELDMAIPKADTTLKKADILVSLTLKNGQSEAIWLHIEVQHDAGDAPLAKRMYDYYQRISQAYGQDVVALAILTGKQKDPGVYDKKRYGSGTMYFYNTLHLSECDMEELRRSDNPVAWAMYAAYSVRNIKGSDKKFPFLREIALLMKEHKASEKTRAGLITFLTRILELREPFEAHRLYGREETTMARYPTNTIEPDEVDILYDAIYQDGELKGERKGKLEMIKNMLSEGFSFAQLTKSSGFTETELRGLLAAQ